MSSKSINSEEVARKLRELSKAYDATGNHNSAALFRDAAILAERKRGTWIELDSCMTICSECNTLGCGSRFCPNCGADMRGDSNE